MQPRRRHTTLRSQRGVTLIESLIALALLALGAAAIGDFMTSQIRHAATNHITTQAYSHAADELERIRALPFAEMLGGTRKVTTGEIDYTIHATVNSGVPAPSMKAVAVTVSWHDPLGARSIDVHTVYTQVTPD